MKPKILFINSVCGFGSTGRIVADLSRIEGFDTLVCFGRKENSANVNSYKFSNLLDNSIAALQTIVFDNNIDVCRNATKRLIDKIKEFNPDIIHMHNLHGYYVDVELLFNFLSEYNKPVVWTLHDSWSFTGYCADIGRFECEKYKSGCKNCPHDFSYPFSIFKQNIENEFNKKSNVFNSIKDLTIVCPSNWLKSMVDQSYLKNNKVIVINNGINLNNFKNSKKKNDKFTALAVSSIWSKDKGPDELNKIIPLLDKDIDVVVVGKDSNKINNCKCIDRTDSVEELCDLYSSSHILVNPTLDDNLPSVNIESLACGTPVITYNTGGSPEIIDEKTGVVVDKKDYQNMANRINEIKNNYYFNIDDCLNRSKQFSREVMVEKYKELYESLLAC